MSNLSSYLFLSLMRFPLSPLSLAQRQLIGAFTHTFGLLRSLAPILSSFRTIPAGIGVGGGVGTGVGTGVGGPFRHSIFSSIPQPLLPPSILFAQILLPLRKISNLSL